MTTTTIPPLPPGYAPAVPPQRRRPTPPEPPTAHGGPPVSGIITTVSGTTGTAVHLHRAGYDVLSPQGGYTVHGYAWRCTGCRHLTTGYLPQDGFRRALEDARDHECGVQS